MQRRTWLTSLKQESRKSKTLTVDAQKFRTKRPLKEIVCAEMESMQTVNANTSNTLSVFKSGEIPQESSSLFVSFRTIAIRFCILVTWAAIAWYYMGPPPFIRKAYNLTKNDTIIDLIAAIAVSEPLFFFGQLKYFRQARV
jgi:hypothetical protein